MGNRGGPAMGIDRHHLEDALQGHLGLFTEALGHAGDGAGVFSHDSQCTQTRTHNEELKWRMIANEKTECCEVCE